MEGEAHLPSAPGKLDRGCSLVTVSAAGRPVSHLLLEREPSSGHIGALSPTCLVAPLPRSLPPLSPRPTTDPPVGLRSRSHARLWKCEPSAHTRVGPGKEKLQPRSPGSASARSAAPAWAARTGGGPWRLQPLHRPTAPALAVLGLPGFRAQPEAFPQTDSYSQLIKSQLIINTPDNYNLIV